MSNLFIQHIPNFVEVREEIPGYEFETEEELLNLDILQKWSNGDDFSHFAISDNKLMAILDNGFHWWVVGFIKEPKGLGFPEWEGWKFRALMPDGSKRVLSDEVVSCCGDDLTLKDGTIVKDLGRASKKLLEHG